MTVTVRRQTCFANWDDNRRRTVYMQRLTTGRLFMYGILDDTWRLHGNHSQRRRGEPELRCHLLKRPQPVVVGHRDIQALPQSLPI